MLDGAFIAPMIEFHLLADGRGSLIVFDQRILAARVHDDGRCLVLERVAGELQVVTVGGQR